MTGQGLSTSSPPRIWRCSKRPKPSCCIAVMKATSDGNKSWVVTGEVIAPPPPCRPPGGSRATPSHRKGRSGSFVQSGGNVAPCRQSARFVMFRLRPGAFLRVLSLRVVFRGVCRSFRLSLTLCAYLVQGDDPTILRGRFNVGDVGESVSARLPVGTECRVRSQGFFYSN